VLNPPSAHQKEAPKLSTSSSELGSLRALEDYNKRGCSTLSLQSFQTSRSGSDARPLTKKRKLIEALAPSSQHATNIITNDTFADDSYIEIDAMSRLNGQDDQPGDKFSLTSDIVVASNSADQMYGLNRATNSLRFASFGLSTDSRGSNWLSSCTSENSSLRSSRWSGPIAEQSSLTFRWGSTEELAKSVTQINLDRPSDNFSEEEIVNIKEAADYLTSFRFDAEAFPLYVLLLKRHQASRGDQSHGHSYPVFASSQAAMLRSHCEILQNLLQLELGKAQQTASTLESFLAHMLLAETYSRGYQNTRNDDVKHHVKMAKTFCPGVDLIGLLPEDSRSLDMLAWHNIVRCLTGNSDLLEEWDDPLYWQEKKGDVVSEVQDVEDALLKRIPGPFEIRDNVMGNPCLSCCVQWCNSELSHISKLPAAWKTNDSAAGFSWANTTALFTFLWDRWHEIQSTYTDPRLDVWVRETEARMGIPPAELLMTLCMMISDSMGTKKLSKFGCALLNNFRRGAQALLRLSDKELARLFLRNIHERYNIVSFSDERKDVQRVARSHIIGLMKSVLQVAMPEGIASRSETPATSSPPLQTLNILAVTILPTMASSLNSAEYSSLRKLRDRIKRTTDTAVQFAAAWPSGRNSSKSVFSLRTMSELSLAMEKSLGLSPMQTHGNSVR
jgi:hypothetical protein